MKLAGRFKKAEKYKTQIHFKCNPFQWVKLLIFSMSTIMRAVFSYTGLLIASLATKC